ncbi:MAG: LytTR family DNA-binding domain-containing protein [Mangrovibacterium sp.]|nr:LytTR family DNA-binding domain-containing protein [Mangrovibacterium sp.]
MVKFLNQPFTLLDDMRHRWILISICTGFGIIFLNVFVPFNINRWSNDSGLREFLRLSGFGLIAGLILAVSQFGIRRATGVEHFRVLTFGLWFIGEIGLMTAAFLLYQSPWISVGRFIGEFPGSLKYTLPGVMIPYSLALLLISLIANRNQLSKLKDKAGKVTFEHGLMDFPDEKGIVRFSVASDQVLYLESADNYVIVFYLSGSKFQKQILRNSMKNVEGLLGSFALERCHRSFMVNLQKIEFIEHERSRCRIKLAGVENLIPVSRKFYPKFKSWIDQDRL